MNFEEEDQKNGMNYKTDVIVGNYKTIKKKSHYTGLVLNPTEKPICLYDHLINLLKYERKSYHWLLELFAGTGPGCKAANLNKL